MDPIRMAGQGGPTTASYRFDDIVVDAGAHTLTRGGERHTVEPKAFAVLLLLLKRPGELIGRDELLDAVWGHRHVTPGVLTRVIAQLRHALGDDSQRPRYIQTQHALGYRFIGELHADAVPVPMAEAVPDHRAGSEPRPAVPVASTAALAEPLPAPPEAANDYAGAEPVHRARHWPWLASGMALLLAVLAAWWFQPRGLLADKPSIAVLPFTTISDRAGDRYFAEGLAAEMHSALASVHGLSVASWMPPEAVAGEDPRTVGARLGVETVLDASVRRDRDRVRINARLTDARNGYTLWSRTYEGDVNDVFATQSDVAQQVVSALMGVLPEGHEGLSRRLRPTANAAAFDAYLRGLKSLADGRSDAAISSFRAALDGDSDFARAQAGICQAEIDRFEAVRDADAFENARLACLRAQKMDPTMGPVRLALGELYRVRGEFAQAKEFYESARSDPEVRSNALVGLAEIESVQGQRQRSLELFGKALQADPTNYYAWSTLGWEQYLDDDLPAAIESTRRAIKLRPERSTLWAALGFYQLTTGDAKEAEKSLERSNALEPNHAATANLATLKYQAKDYAAAAAMYRQATQLDPGDFYPWGYLGDTLVADPSVGEARQAYREAADRAQRYVRLRTDDARAFAALAWYLTSLGEREQVPELMARAEKLGTAQGDVALFNAQTYAVLGDKARAKACIATARANGVSAALVDTNVVLQRAGLSSQ